MIAMTPCGFGVWTRSDRCSFQPFVDDGFGNLVGREGWDEISFFTTGHFYDADI